MDGVKVEFDLAAVGDAFGVGDRLRQGRKSRGHLCGGFEVERIRLHAHAVGIAHALASLHAQEDLMGMGVVRHEIMAIIGGNQGNAGFTADLDQLRVDQGLLGDAIMLQLEVEIAPAEQLIVGLGQLDSPCAIVLHQGTGYFAAEAGREGDQSRRVLAQQVMVNARAVVKAINKPGRDQFHQVLPAGLIFSQQDQV